MEQKIITRKEAKALGLKRYFTGEPCKHGHMVERYVSDGRCVVCSAERMAAKYRADPEQGRADQRRRRAANPDQYRATDRKNYEKNKPARKAAQDRYRAKNQHKVRAVSAKWRAENAEYNKARIAAWRKANLARCAAREASRRADKDRATPPWADLLAIQAIYDTCPKGHEVDHIVPLKGKNVCGLHCEANLQYLSRSDNARKRNKHDPDTHEHQVPIWLDDMEFVYG